MDKITVGENIADYLKSRFGEGYLRKYEEYINSDFTPYVRFPIRADRQKLISRLEKYGIKLRQVENIPYAYQVLEGRENLGKTLEYTIGKYYIQSLSSMIPPIVLSPTENDVTLDLASAPGSKTTQLSDMMNNRGTLYANESNLNRIKMLVHNLDRMNLVNLGVIKHRGEKLSKIFENKFTKVLVDAPCSALGILQKKNEVSGWWKLSQAEKLAELQFRLIVSAIKMAKVGAEIVYSTCTLTLEENELVVNKILKKYPVELKEIKLPVKSVPGYTKYGEEKLNPELEKTHRIIPWENNSEGFFVCKFIKTDETEPMKKTELPKKNFDFVSPNHRTVKKYLENISERFDICEGAFEDFKFLIKKNEIYFLTNDFQYENLDAFLRIGARFGKIDKNNIAHLHTLSAQILGNKIRNNMVELTAEELNEYLRGGTIRKAFEPFGQKIVKFDDYIIGTAIAYRDGLKSQFPRSLRTHNILEVE